MKFAKIALTGGPCGGKSSALMKIYDAFTKMGYKVFLHSEMASELFSSGIDPTSEGSVYKYQETQFFFQATKEDALATEALASGADKILIVCDRGLPDNAAYLSDKDYYTLLCSHNLHKTEILNRYDAVFHLTTSAKKDFAIYDRNKNDLRKEDARKAAQLDDRIILAWQNHPNRFFIDPMDDFDQKMNTLLKEIADFLEEETPYLYVESYVIKQPVFPETGEFSVNVCHEDLYKPNRNTEIKIISDSDRTQYILSQGDFSKFIDKADFLRYMDSPEQFLKKISSDVYSFYYNDCFCQIRKYEHNSDNARLTIEKRDDKQLTIVPEFIQIIGRISN